MDLALPPPEPITGTSEPRLPFVFVGDEAFPLLPNLLRLYPGDYLPYEKRVYNYRLSRARGVVENAFGILASKFRFLRRPMIMSPNNAEAIVLGAAALHNFLHREVGLHYIGPKSTDYETSHGDWQPGQWRAEGVGNMLRPMQRHGKRSTDSAAAVRDAFKTYFCSEGGAVSWQEAVVNRTS